ncbi:hypothetical protein ACFL35_00880 [Candidatus Riflebacteria bacterium]
MIFVNQLKLICKKGSVMVTVLVVLFILALLYANFMSTRTSVITQYKSALAERQAYFIARAGINHACHKIRYTPIFFWDAFRYIKDSYARNKIDKVSGKIYFDPVAKGEPNNLNQPYFFYNKQITIREYLMQYFEGSDQNKYKGKLKALLKEQKGETVKLDLGMENLTAEYEVTNMYFRFTIDDIGKSSDKGESMIMLDSVNQFLLGIEVEARVYDSKNKNLKGKGKDGKDLALAEKKLTKELVITHNTILELDQLNQTAAKGKTGS